MTELATIEPQLTFAPAWYRMPDGRTLWWNGQTWDAPVMVNGPAGGFPRKIVSTQKKKTSHAFHLIMTICTFGLWAPFWFLSAFAALLPRQHVSRLR